MRKCLSLLQNAGRTPSILYHWMVKVSKNTFYDTACNVIRIIQNDVFKSNNDHIFLPTMTYKNLFGFREWQRESFIRNFLRKHVKDKVTIHFFRWIWLPSDCGIMIAFNNMTMPSHILLSSHWPRKRVCEKHFNIKNQSFSTAKIGLHSIEID